SSSLSSWIMVPMAPSSTRMRSRAMRRSVCSVLVLGTSIGACSGLLPLPAGERGGVRELGRLLIERVQDLFKHAVEILHHIVVPEPKHKISHRLQGSRPLFVLRRAIRVLAAIKLNDQLPIGTNKVGDEAINRRLSFELPARKSTTAQTKPQDSFCIRLLSTQRS